MSFCTQCAKDTCEGCELADSEVMPPEMERIVTISGFPTCPACMGVQLALHNPTVDGKGWYCPGCGTEWYVWDLIKAMNMEQEESDG